MTTYTTNILLQEPVPLAAATNNTWGVSLNTGVYTLIDQAASGDLIIAAHSGTTVLTSLNGAVDQARNKYFNITGALTGNVILLMPQSVGRFFLVNNQATGSFTVSFGVNNGSGSPAGTIQPIPPNKLTALWSDGTNINYDGLAPNKALQQSVIATTTSFVGCPANGSPVTYLSKLFSPIYTDSIVTAEVSVGYQVAALVGENPTGLFNAFLTNTIVSATAKAGTFSPSTSPSTTLSVTLVGAVNTVIQQSNPPSLMQYNLQISDANASGVLVAGTSAVLIIQEWR